ncbi:MAG: hypothetical protein KKH22_10980 [Proteobacteria bacterium]|nr:hypothetical protein [Pseudomonadota bacterium]
MTFESKLTPILREGVEIVKMISFKKIKDALAKKYPEMEPPIIGKLAGALVNAIFGTPSLEESFVIFARNHADLITKEQTNLEGMLEEIRIPLTDALRIQSLCDHQEGLDSTGILQQAQKLGILLVDRDLPLPHSFIELVRRLGSGFGLLLPPIPDSDAATSH